MKTTIVSTTVQQSGSSDNKPHVLWFGAGAARTIAAEAVEGSAGKEGDRAGAMLLAGRKRARLMPARTYEKVTPEGGEY